jgi:uncharacterized protein YdaL
VVIAAGAQTGDYLNFIMQKVTEFFEDPLPVAKPFVLADLSKFFGMKLPLVSFIRPLPSQESWAYKLLSRRTIDRWASPEPRLGKVG